MLQKLQNCLSIAKILYKICIPDEIKFRHNVQLAKLQDYQVIALLLFQTELGILTRTRFYRFIVQNQLVNLNNLPEESRFNRICNRDYILLQIIRNYLIKYHTSAKYVIIDSLPIPLCNSIRRFRAKVLSKIANLGYNSTKQMHFYGLKGHFIVSNNGIVLNYSITKASIHDVKVARTLIQLYPAKYILADKGYISNNLKKWCHKRHQRLWTPPRKNERRWYQFDWYLLRLRRHIESVFAQLKRLFDVEHNYGKSLNGFQSRLEQCLLVDTLLKLNYL